MSWCDCVLVSLPECLPTGPGSLFESAGKTADLAVFPVDPQPIVGSATAECDRFDRSGRDALSTVVAVSHSLVDTPFELVKPICQFTDRFIRTASRRHWIAGTVLTGADQCDRDHGGEQRRDGARYGDGGDDFARRMLRLHKLTMSLTRDDGSDKWVEASPIEDLEEAA